MASPVGFTAELYEQKRPRVSVGSHPIFRLLSRDAGELFFRGITRVRATRLVIHLARYPSLLERPTCNLPPLLEASRGFFFTARANGRNTNTGFFHRIGTANWIASREQFVDVVDNLPIFATSFESILNYRRFETFLRARDLDARVTRFMGKKVEERTRSWWINEK